MQVPFPAQDSLPDWSSSSSMKRERARPAGREFSIVARTRRETARFCSASETPAAAVSLLMVVQGQEDQMIDRKYRAADPLCAAALFHPFVK